MAASVNNIAATFASSGKISSKLQSSSIPTSKCLAMNTHSSSPIVAWNPQAKLPPSYKSSFVGFYGGPGPKQNPFLNPRRKTLKSSTSHFSLFQSTRASASISVGDKLPEATLSYIDNEDNLQTVTISDLTRGKKTVLFAVPGAFTPTCSQKHLPGFVEKSDELKEKGIDHIVCISVNDAFVMKAWGEDLDVGDKVLLLADGNGVFTKALGLTLDLSDKPAGLAIRSRRYALMADDGVVKVLKVEDGGAFTVSGADDILKAL